MYKPLAHDPAKPFTISFPISYLAELDRDVKKKGIKTSRSSYLLDLYIKEKKTKQPKKLI